MAEYSLAQRLRMARAWSGLSQGNLAGSRVCTTCRLANLSAE